MSFPYYGLIIRIYHGVSCPCLQNSLSQIERYPNKPISWLYFAIATTLNKSLMPSQEAPVYCIQCLETIDPSLPSYVPEMLAKNHLNLGKYPTLRVQFIFHRRVILSKFQAPNPYKMNIVHPNPTTIQDNLDLLKPSNQNFTTLASFPVTIHNCHTSKCLKHDQLKKEEQKEELNSLYKILYLHFDLLVN